MDDVFEWDKSEAPGLHSRTRRRFRGCCADLRNRVVERTDAREGYGEVRIRALGRVDALVFMVADTWRGSVRRIIGAWKVGENGRRRQQALLDE